MFLKSAFALICTVLISSSASALEWKGIFIAGDDSIPNFDNGRVDLTAMFSQLGTLTTTQLSSSAAVVEQSPGVLLATADNIVPAFENLGVATGSGLGCLIHMTSHGAKGQGFYLSQAGILPPDVLAQLVDVACGDQPTVILVSACYSGQFITDGLAGPNRVILTAARADRPSFGCSTDTTYTYWDECLLTEVPKSSNWPEAYQNVNKCITGKETALGAQPSEPQAFFGENTADWTILQ